MFETGARQFRLAMSIVWGRRIDPGNVERLVSDALDTIREFGEPGADVTALTDGPLTDPEERRNFTDSNPRRTARRLGRASPFSSRRFSDVGVRPEEVGLDALPRLPVTRKPDLVAQAESFRCT